MTQVKGIFLKKKHGQNFLRDQSVVDHMLEKVDLTAESSVFEIGCGDGFLTRSILQKPLARLWIFEIDPEWAHYVKSTYPDKRMRMIVENVLDVDFNQLEPYKPWTLLANLPYHVTFPILHKLVENRALLREGVIMVQEEVAQKIVGNRGREYGFPSVYFQHFFDWKLLNKVKPGAFVPPPKVDSRLLYFKPKTQLDSIEHEPEFWNFIKACFKQPRRMLKNNLEHLYDISKVPTETLQLRAQQMSKQDLMQLWTLVRSTAA